MLCFFMVIGAGAVVDVSSVFLPRVGGTPLIGPVATEATSCPGADWDAETGIGARGTPDDPFWAIEWFPNRLSIGPAAACKVCGGDFDIEPGTSMPCPVSVRPSAAESWQSNVNVHILRLYGGFYACLTEDIQSTRCANQAAFVEFPRFFREGKGVFLAGWAIPKDWDSYGQEHGEPDVGDDYVACGTRLAARGDSGKTIGLVIAGYHKDVAGFQWDVAVDKIIYSILCKDQLSCHLSIDSVPSPIVDAGFCDASYTISRADKPSNAVRIVTKGFGYFIDPLLGIPVFEAAKTSVELPPQASIACPGFDWEDPSTNKMGWGVNIADPGDAGGPVKIPTTHWPFCGSKFILKTKASSTGRRLLSEEEKLGLEVTIAAYDSIENPTIGISPEACQQLECNPVCDPWSRCVVELELIREFDDDIGRVESGVVDDDKLKGALGRPEGNHTESMVKIYPWFYDECHGVGCGLTEEECGSYALPCPVSISSNLKLADQNGNLFPLQGGDFITIRPFEITPSTNAVIFAMVVGSMGTSNTGIHIPASTYTLFCPYVCHSTCLPVSQCPQWPDQAVCPCGGPCTELPGTAFATRNVGTKARVEFYRFQSSEYYVEKNRSNLIGFSGSRQAHVIIPLILLFFGG